MLQHSQLNTYLPKLLLMTGSNKKFSLTEDVTNYTDVEQA